MLLNLLLRTHNRPLGFKRMLGSIKSQTYTDYRIIVSVDNEVTEKYVIDNGISDYIKICPDPKHQFPADAYFNTMLAEVKEGYVWCVDDDDFVAHERVLEIIACNVVQDKISIFKMQTANNSVLPGPGYFGSKVEVCHIGTPCFVVPIDIAKQVKWGGISGSDFFYIRDVVNLVGYDHVLWVDEIIYKIDKPSQRGRGEF